MLTDKLLELCKLMASILDEMTRIYSCGSIINQIDRASIDFDDDGA